MADGAKLVIVSPEVHDELAHLKADLHLPSFGEVIRALIAEHNAKSPPPPEAKA